MNTRVKTTESYKPTRSYFPIEDEGYDDQITSRQRRVLTDLIFQYMFEDDRDRLLEQLDGMTKDDADEMICEIRSNNWR